MGNNIKLKTKVFNGWIDPTDPQELPIKVTERTQIVFGTSKWNPHDVPITIVLTYPKEDTDC